MTPHPLGSGVRVKGVAGVHPEDRGLSGVVEDYTEGFEYPYTVAFLDHETGTTRTEQFAHAELDQL